jgi:hypothetical protein
VVKEREMGSSRLPLDGAIDMHVHFGPEPLTVGLSGQTHNVDPMQAAAEAQAEGMRAIVLKAHEFASTTTAYLASASVPDTAVLGGMCCDHPVGGINEVAVETTLGNDGRVIWLPTISSRTMPAEAMQTIFGDVTAVAVTDADGQLLPEVRGVLDRVREHDAVLATGHITREEHFAVAQEFGHRGRLLVTHAMQAGFGPELTPDDCVELAELGAVLELSAHSCMGSRAGLDKVVEVVGRIAPQHLILSTDYGWSNEQPHPAEGFRGYMTALWELGVPENLIHQLTRSSPAALLGL